MFFPCSWTRNQEANEIPLCSVPSLIHPGGGDGRGKGPTLRCQVSIFSFHSSTSPPKLIIHLSTPGMCGGLTIPIIDPWYVVWGHLASIQRPVSDVGNTTVGSQLNAGRKELDAPLPLSTPNILVVPRSWWLCLLWLTFRTLVVMVPPNRRSTRCAKPSSTKSPSFIEPLTG